jgi:YbbR domain-containing protein
MRDWITKDFGWKLFSVFLAVAVWLTVHKIRGEPVEQTAPFVGNVTYGDLPIQIVSASADVHNFHVTPSTVEVTVNGPTEVMAKLQADQVRAVVNLTGVQPDRNSRRPVDISAPPGVTLVSVDPPEVAVTIPKKQ